MSFLLWIVLCSGLLWGLVVWLERRRERGVRRILEEDAVKHLFEFEAAGEDPSPHSLAGHLGVSVDRVAQLLGRLQRMGQVLQEKGLLRLSEAGRERATHLVRAHRLWERYLADRTGHSALEWHGRAERLEHTTSREAAAALEAELGHPSYDPHGDPIPTSSGAIPKPSGRSLLEVTPGRRVRVTHVEDEPEAVYARLVEAGLYPGMAIELLEVSPQGVALQIEGRRLTLPSVVAANLTVTPLEEKTIVPPAQHLLSDLRVGEAARVVSISRASRRPERRRFMDLGILPGTPIRAELSAPGGDPVGYRVRGALIALRREQADHIVVIRESAP